MRDLMPVIDYRGEEMPWFLLSFLQVSYGWNDCYAADLLVNTLHYRWLWISVFLVDYLMAPILLDGWASNNIVTSSNQMHDVRAIRKYHLETVASVYSVDVWERVPWIATTHWSISKLFIKGNKECTQTHIKNLKSMPRLLILHQWQSSTQKALKICV